MAKRKKRKHNKSSAKGGGFEREMCKAWSLWWTQDERNDVFWRTSGSGSRATTRGKAGVEDQWNHGDMKPDDPEGFDLCRSWCFEFKFYQKYDIKGTLHHVAERGDWMKWWAKLVGEAAHCNREPILVTKQNAGEPVIWFHARTWFALQPYCDLPDCPMIRLIVTKRKVKIALKNKTKKTKTIKLDRHEVFGVPLRMWFKWADPESIKDYVTKV